MTQLYDQRREFARWMLDAGVDVFGTLKFHNGYEMRPEKGRKAIRHYWNTVDRQVFGKPAVKRGRRIIRFVFRHVGVSGYNDHFHFAAKSAGDVEVFCRRLRLLWYGLREADERFSFIEPIRNPIGAAFYLTHEIRQLSNETFQPDLSHIGVPQDMASVR